MNSIRGLLLVSMFNYIVKPLLVFALLGGVVLRADYGQPFSGAEAKVKSWGVVFIKGSDVIGFVVYKSGRTPVPLDLPAKQNITSACLGYGPIEMVKDSKYKESGVEISVREASTALDILRHWSFEPIYNVSYCKVSGDGSLEPLIYPVTRLLNHFCSFGLWLTLKDGRHVYIDGHVGNKFVVLRKEPEDKNPVTVENSVYADYLEFLDKKYNSDKPNKSVQPTPTAVMPAAEQPARQP